LTSYEIPEGRPEEKFIEKYPLLSRTEAMFEASRCIYCFDAPCIQSCPTSIDIPTFIRKIATGNVRGSARTILKANLLGDSCARVCPVEVLCESTCVFHEQDRPPIPIGRLQRYAMANGFEARLLLKAHPTGHSIGLIGSGPASLACAGTLALLGHSPVIYEKDAWPGGLNATGVASYKLKLEDALDEVGFIQSLGVEIQTGVEVGVDVTTDELLGTHQAVFLGVGLGADSSLGVAGEDGDGVVGAVAWIRRVKTDPTLLTDGVMHAVVIGGGNTAIDAVRQLVGLDVPFVSMVYRRSRDEMSGYDHELSPALDEGVSLVENAAVSQVVHENGKVAGVHIVETDENGRPTENDLGVITADLVVLAIGQGKLVDLVKQFGGISMTATGNIVVDDDMATGNPRIFAGGDAINGGKEVVNAVHDGQVAAHSIDALLRSSDHG
jgi:dihydropyrimidine dehydrogenase (NAD+) subunit PreT